MFQVSYQIVKDVHKGIRCAEELFFHVPSKFTSQQILENPVSTIIYSKLSRNLYKVLNYILF